MRNIAYQIVTTEFAFKRDKGGHSYVNHLLRVELSVTTKLSPGSNFLEEAKTIALLHDLLEDCPEWTFTHLNAIFGQKISDKVLLLTKDKDQDYQKYIERIATDPIARAVKMADLEDNMNMSRLPEITDKDIERLRKYHDAYLFLAGKKKQADEEDEDLPF